MCTDAQTSRVREREKKKERETHLQRGQKLDDPEFCSGGTQSYIFAPSSKKVGHIARSLGMLVSRYFRLQQFVLTYNWILLNQYTSNVVYGY